MTVTGVDLTPDRKLATVHYSIMGDAEQKKSTAHALNRAAAYVRRTVANRLSLKVIPAFVFVYDETPLRASRIETLLEQISKEKK